MIEYIAIPPALADIDSTLARGEKVACRNATVIVNANGIATCWFDNSKQLLIIRDESPEQEEQ